METAKELWEDLRERFAIGNDLRIHQLKNDLANCKQEGMIVSGYYGKMKTMWEELAGYVTNPQCTCGECKCGAATELVLEREKEKIHQFLMGLVSAVYGTIRSNILSTDPLPSLNRIHAIIVQEEWHKTVARAHEERGEAVGFAVQTGNRAKVPNNDEKMCSHCGKTRHEVLECFQLVGYPDWWYAGKGGCSGGHGGREGRGTGTRRGRGGSGTAAANAVQTPGSCGASTTVAAIRTSNKDGFPGLNDEQWATLMAMINSHKESASEKLTGKKMWLIDLGCSHNMTGNLELLKNVREISPCAVGLPDGKNMMALQEGEVQLGKLLILKHVLYVPNLNCNLISVSQFIGELKCTVTFSDKMCVMQDPSSRTMIGVGEKRDGVYLWHCMERTSACRLAKVDSYELWHRRIAKQTRDVFPLSNNKASAPFSLIHCDVWGPYRAPASCGAIYFLTVVDDYSWAVWIYLMVERSELSANIVKFCAMANLPISFWGESMLTTGYLINRSPSPLLDGKSPYELLFGKEPTYKHIRVFWCLCHAHYQGRDKDKFGSRSRRCVFVGYPFGKKGWRLYDLDTNEFFVSHDVVFSEHIFPYKVAVSESLNTGVVEQPPVCNDDVHFHELDSANTSNDEPTPEKDLTLEARGSSKALNERRGNDVNLERNSEGENLGRGCRERRPLEKLKDYVCHTAQHINDPLVDHATSCHSSGVSYPIARYVTCTNFSLRHR
ncbi:PREDICTED: uncharacterized protein LOC104605176 [Nelumbo nucifera]|uniref:Uncharacterized protein LOC104605176 n=1 Tax=Nelumbo nucifera TaxID=4432 RepID=A0A1U8ALA1_NELNU|nr:PREDICTED: uncharacterized protein LOC104605176 [Nelumbo nucifera]